MKRVIIALALTFGLTAAATAQNVAQLILIPSFVTQKMVDDEKDLVIGEGYAAAKIADAEKQMAGGNRSVRFNMDGYGGSVDEAAKLAVYMKDQRANGVTFVCQVSRFAFSANFWLFAQCDTRIIKKSAKFLWHRVRVGYMGYLTSDLCIYIAALLDQTQREVDTALRLRWKVSDEVFVGYRDVEKFMTALELVNTDKGFIHRVY